MGDALFAVAALWRALCGEGGQCAMQGRQSGAGMAAAGNAMQGGRGMAAGAAWRNAKRPRNGGRCIKAKRPRKAGVVCYMIRGSNAMIHRAMALIFFSILCPHFLQHSGGGGALHGRVNADLPVVYDKNIRHPFAFPARAATCPARGARRALARRRLKLF